MRPLWLSRGSESTAACSRFSTSGTDRALPFKICAPPMSWRSGNTPSAGTHTRALSFAPGLSPTESPTSSSANCSPSHLAGGGSSGPSRRGGPLRAGRIHRCAGAPPSSRHPGERTACPVQGGTYCRSFRLDQGIPGCALRGPGAGHLGRNARAQPRGLDSANHAALERVRTDGGDDERTEDGPHTQPTVDQSAGHEADVGRTTALAAWCNARGSRRPIGRSVTGRGRSRRSHRANTRTV